MDFLFDNPLANLYGPYFLIFYVSFITCTIIGYRFLRARIDKTAHYAIPPIPVNPDPFEIAYLRGGANELARAAVFSLNQKVCCDSPTTRKLRIFTRPDSNLTSAI